MTPLRPFKKARLPEPPTFIKILGPSFILLGLGLGSGEIILWPYLVSNFGLGIIWGAILGITFQFFVNLEIERYALIRGESIFVGFARLWKHLPIWFILSTFIGFGWPGIIASSGKILSHLIGIDQFHLLTIALLVIIGVILTLGPILYKTVENFQKTIILIGVPSLIVITALIAKSTDFEALLKGSVGIGPDYFLLPDGIPLLAFLAAFAFSGAGGNLNLSQSFYIKEKGFGMGKYSHGIQSVLTGKSNKVDLEGTTFEIDGHNVSNFKKWWKIITIEHFLVFLVTGIISILLLAVLAYSTTYSLPGNFVSIDFIINEANMISSMITPEVGAFFLMLTGLMLFATQFAVLDSTSRIISENIVLTNSKRFSRFSIPKIYYIVLWSQIAFGIIVLLSGLTDPRILITVQAVINAIAMFAHIGFTYLLNRTLPTQLRPTRAKSIIILAIFSFFGIFSAYSLWAYIK